MTTTKLASPAAAERLVLEMHIAGYSAVAFADTVECPASAWVVEAFQKKLAYTRLERVLTNDRAA